MTIENENSEELDITSLAEEIGSDLFGQEDGPGDDVESSDEGEAESSLEASPSEIEEPVDEPSTDVPTEEAGENSSEVQALGAPQTWTKEALAEWAKVPPRVQQEILKREEDMHRGLEQYKEKAELGSKYDAVADPYRPILASQNIDPVELFQNFAGNHYILARGTPEQKVSLFTEFAKFYQIDMDRVYANLANEPKIDPQIQQLQQRIESFEQDKAQAAEAARQAKLAEFQAEVSAFEADPKNIYFAEVASDIAKLLQSGVASTLREAYDKAVYNNPTTRQKEIDRITSEKLAESRRIAQEKAELAKKATSPNVATKPKNRNGTVPIGSIDDTLNETLAKIQARG